MPYRIGALGPRDAVLPFKIFGFDVRFVTTKEEVLTVLDEMVAKEYGVIYLTEALAAEIPEKLQGLQEKLLPAITLLPDFNGTTGLAQALLQDNVQKAVGQNILQKKE
ncbi:V-type ATP synthase subunit F [Enterococcus nangangensis]